MLSKSSLSKPFAGLALLAIASAAQADITVYTSRAAFQAAITAPGVDSYDDLPLASLPTPLFRQAGPYAYTASTTLDDFYMAGSPDDVWLATFESSDTIVLGSFAANVAGVGGNFFGTDEFGGYAPGSVTVTATDAGGTVTRTIDLAATDSFLGFVSNTGALSQLTLASVAPADPSLSLWPTVNNLTLGVAAAVPEPGSPALMLAGLACLVFVARARRG